MAPTPLSTADPSGSGVVSSQHRILLGILAIGGAVGLFVGTLLPWIKADMVGGTLIARNGVDEGEWILLLMAAIAGLSALFFAVTGVGSLGGFGRPRRRWDRGAHLIFGLCTAAVLATKWFDLNDRIHAARAVFDGSASYATANLGVGFYLAAVGAFLLVAAGIREFQVLAPGPQSPRQPSVVDRSASATAPFDPAGGACPDCGQTFDGIFYLEAHRRRDHAPGHRLPETILKH